MSVQVRRRRETASFLATFVGAQGELLVDTTNNRVQVHDGATAGGFPAARLSEVITNTRTAVSDGNYTASVSDRTIAFTALSAARSVTLPAASQFPTGTQLLVVDESGACSASNTIGLVRLGSDLVNGGTSATIAAAYGYLAVESNGVGRWTIVDQAIAVPPPIPVPVRQTVMGGPISGGLPSFLPATAASLTLTAQNVATSAALLVTAAQGFGSAGAINLVLSLTSNPVWTLTASVTNFLTINAASGATGVLTLAPIYQSGGTPSVAAGQFTFDTLAMVGYLGNGTSAVATPLVVVGEAVASASAVTSAVAYAYNGMFDSGFTGTLQGAASVATKNHNLGLTDVQAKLTVKNLTAEGNYTAGQILDGLAVNATVALPPPLIVGRLTISSTSGSAGQGFQAVNATTGVAFAMTSANWAPRYTVRRTW